MQQHDDRGRGGGSHQLLLTFYFIKSKVIIIKVILSLPHNKMIDLISWIFGPLDLGAFQRPQSLITGSSSYDSKCSHSILGRQNRCYASTKSYLNRSTQKGRPVTAQKLLEI
jgi:hypothetical protein